MIDNNLRQKIERVLIEHGAASSIHGWRCDYPDIYPGYCTCVEDLATALTEEIEKEDA